MLDTLQQQINDLYYKVKEIKYNDTTSVLRMIAETERLSAQYRNNTELLILQTHLQIMNSQEQKARAIANRVWELGGNISLMFEKMYLDDLINLHMTDMATVLIRPKFENINDGMKKEGIPFRTITIVSFALFLLTFVYMFLNNKSLYDKEALSMFLMFLMFAIIGLYGWLYSANYRVVINNTQILLKTLFCNKQYNICDVEKYTCNRYKKSVFYQFTLFIKGKRVLVNTRYKEEFETILRENRIEQINI
jgi:hypothetical protein